MDSEVRDAEISEAGDPPVGFTSTMDPLGFTSTMDPPGEAEHLHWL